jgi:hypothetical protein
LINGFEIKFIFYGPLCSNDSSIIPRKQSSYDANGGIGFSDTPSFPSSLPRRSSLKPPKSQLDSDNEENSNNNYKNSKFDNAAYDDDDNDKLADEIKIEAPSKEYLGTKRKSVAFADTTHVIQIGNNSENVN